MAYLKAKVFLLLVAILWLSLIIAMLPLMVIAVIFDRDWLYSLFLSQDHLVNVVLGGHYLTTISSQLGKLRQDGSRTGTVAADFVDWLFYIARKEIRHCDNAMQPDDIYTFKPWVSLFSSSIYIATVWALI